MTLVKEIRDCRDTESHHDIDLTLEVPGFAEVMQILGRVEDQLNLGDSKIRLDGRLNGRLDGRWDVRLLQADLNSMHDEGNRSKKNSRSHTGQMSTLMNLTGKVSTRNFWGKKQENEILAQWFKGKFGVCYR